MKADKYITEHDELMLLIDRYFDGATSLEQERRLRLLLAESDSDAEAVEEARAVLGIFAESRRRLKCSSSTGAKQSIKHSYRSPIWVVSGIAASIAVIIGAVLTLTHLSVDEMSSNEVLTVASNIGVAADSYDSIAELMPQVNQHVMPTRRSPAMAVGSVNRPDNPADVAALISSEMGYMAEAQRSTYESISNDIVAITSIME